jgi:hypothetical protein
VRRHRRRRFAEEIDPKTGKKVKREAGYLAPRVHHFGGGYRPTEARENTYEAKHGTGHG